MFLKLNDRVPIQLFYVCIYFLSFPIHKIEIEKWRNGEKGIVIRTILLLLFIHRFLST